MFVGITIFIQSKTHTLRSYRISKNLTPRSSNTIHQMVEEYEFFYSYREIHKEKHIMRIDNSNLQILKKCKGKT